MEKITIKEFIGLPEMEYEIKKLNLIIWEQASGKSLLCKLIYFFQEIPDLLFDGIVSGKTYKQELYNAFKIRFPLLCKWGIDVSYEYPGGVCINIKSNEKNLSFTISNNIISLYNSSKKHYLSDEKRKNTSLRIDGLKKILKAFFGKEIDTEYIYMPATRSFFSMIKGEETLRILSMRPKSELEFFTKDFIIKLEKQIRNVQRFEEKFNEDVFNKKIKEIFEKIAKWSPVINKNGDINIKQGKNNIPLHLSSSWQQELIPIQMALQWLFLLYKRLSNWVGNYSVTNSAQFFCILEEPESHIFPWAQKEIIDLIVSFMKQFDTGITFFITTHSPYVLKSLNNALLRGKNNPKDDTWIQLEDCSSSFLSKTWMTSILDKEHWIILAKEIDNVAKEIDDEFIRILYK